MAILKSGKKVIYLTQEQADVFNIHFPEGEFGTRFRKLVDEYVNQRTLLTNLKRTLRLLLAFD